jgi:REP element-mobilizing transposase RayT
MSERYKVKDPEATYFMTLTIVDWVDLFTRDRYVTILIDSLNYCIQNKGLVVYAYVVMPSHVHLLATGREPLNEIIRDLKKHTSKLFAKAIVQPGESRSEWLLKKFAFAASRNKRATGFKIWKDGFHPKIMDRMEKLEAVVRYIHYNPVEAGYVQHEQDWLWSSARDYCDGMQSEVHISRMY